MSLLIGIIIGLVLGLTGAGGSVFAVPLLVLLLSLPLSHATGIALAAVTISAGIGAIKGWMQGNIVIMPALLLSSSGMVMAPLGKQLGYLLPEPVLMAGFSLLAALIAAWMWHQAVRYPEQTAVIRAAHMPTKNKPELLCPLGPNGQFQLKPRCMAGLITSGMFIGLLSGLFGVGGGFLIVPLLLFSTGLSYAAAVTTSLMVITLISGAGLASYLYLDEAPPMHILLMVIGGSVAGMLCGFTLGKHLAGPQLQKIFAFMLLLAGLTTLLKLIFDQ